MSKFFKIKNDTIHLEGEWISANVAKILKKIPKTKINKVDANDLDLVDTSGAYLITKHFGGAEIANLSKQQKQIFEVINETEIDSATKEPHIGFLEKVGRNTYTFWEGAKTNMSFVGELFLTLLSSLARPTSIRYTSITHHIMQAGIKAIPLVMLIAFLIAVVLVYQGAVQLQKFGADIFIVDLVGISVLREMGVLLTAVMIAGRSGSSYTAEIGVMKVNEEIDAMRTIGLNPMEVVVLPRVIALIILLPLLTLVADLAGMLGGAIAANAMLDIPFSTFADRAQGFIKIEHFWVGIVKAPVFGLLIAMIACMRGMQVTGSSESVGIQTTRSVVEAIFMVFIVDALFSILFVKMGV